MLLDDVTVEIVMYNRQHVAMLQRQCGCAKRTAWHHWRGRLMLRLAADS